jgi:hypothetical protein
MIHFVSWVPVLRFILERALMGYAWDLQHHYLRESGLERGLKGWIAKAILHYIRLWDVRTANGVDGFIGWSCPLL